MAAIIYERSNEVSFAGAFPSPHHLPECRAKGVGNVCSCWSDYCCSRVGVCGARSLARSLARVAPQTAMQQLWQRDKNPIIVK